MLTIERYTPQWQERWNEFAACSRCDSFLFQRGYMDYHADRFTDCSLIALRGRRIVAVLPAEIDSGGTVGSHRGLTYGGWITPLNSFNATAATELWDSATDAFQRIGAKRLAYKKMPYIYLLRPGDEDLHEILRRGGGITKCELTSAIDLRDGVPPFRENIRQAVAKADAAGVTAPVDATADEVWHILTARLAERYGAAPVHTLCEIKMLAQRFPDNIFFTGARLKGELAAVAVLYSCGRVLRTQSLAPTEAGRACGALAKLLSALLSRASRRYAYFDLGTSTSPTCPGGINPGLTCYKAGFGAGGVNALTLSLPLH